MAPPQVYYVNPLSGASSWELPVPEWWSQHAHPSMEDTTYYVQHSGATSWECPSAPVATLAQQAAAVAQAGWVELHDAPSGIVFYVNPATRAATRAKPAGWT